MLFVGARLLDGTLHLSLSESVFLFLVAFPFLDGATSSLGRDLFLVMIPFVTAPVTSIESRLIIGRVFSLGGVSLYLYANLLVSVGVPSF